MSRPSLWAAESINATTAFHRSSCQRSCTAQPANFRAYQPNTIAAFRDTAAPKHPYPYVPTRLS